ncbi:MAG: hypothetical protein P4L64_12095 [Caulobacteraceae bacterium]|nr:hypothetical protein [Caulobacteraceae bacterium]
MFAALPLLALPVLFYNLLGLMIGGGLRSSAMVERMSAPIFSVTMASRAVWTVSLGDLFLAGSLVVLFVELLKPTTSRQAAIINHSLSMVLFIACLVEFLLFPAFATSTFFILTLMVLLDVLAGFIVTIVAARREIDIR